jgi:hypothetical protein
MIQYEQIFIVVILYIFFKFVIIINASALFIHEESECENVKQIILKLAESAY